MFWDEPLRQVLGEDSGLTPQMKCNERPKMTMEQDEWERTREAQRKVREKQRQLLEPSITHAVSWAERTIAKTGMVRGPLEAEWSPIALWIADQIRDGIQPVRLPPWEELIASICWNEKVEYRFRCLAGILTSPPDDQPTRTEQLDSKNALELLRSLMRVFPSVPWAMYEHQIEHAVQLYAQSAQAAISVVEEIKPDDPCAPDHLRLPLQKVVADAKPEVPGSPDHLRLPMPKIVTGAKPEALCIEKLRPTTSGARGTFHEAVRSYLKKRRADFTTGDTFNGSGHHMLGLVENFEKRQPDAPLSQLDFAGCQQIYDFWRNRPLNTRTEQPLSAKHCSSHVGELDRFFKWLHTTPEFAWKRPDDFDMIDRRVKRLDSDRRSLQYIELKTFQVEHLALLYKHALPSERLKLVWCLNCSHGAAEMGRVEWQDIYLEQPHPWIKEGLKLESSASDSWCGLLRPKTDVIGWWCLWPETVQFVKWWRGELQQVLKRELLPSERMLLTSTGEPLYRDSSRNAQSSFTNEWRRLLDRVATAEGKHAVPRLPFGTLRDQLSNWLGSDENLAVLASTALAHGLPHKGDKLLFGRYANRPWAPLFQKQREYRQVLQPMFSVVSDPFQVV